MADNTTLDSGSGGDDIRTEDKSGVKTQVVLLDVAGTGAENLVTDGTQGMPTEGVAAENAAAAGNPVLVGARYDASPRTLDDGDVGAIALDADGAVHIADGGNSITVDNAGTFVAQIDGTALTRLTDIETNTDFGATTGGGAESGALRVTIANDSTGVVSVDDGGGALTVDNGGTFVVQVDGSALTALQLLDNTVYVDDADWTATSSSHNLVGGVYQSTPGTVTDGDTGPFRINSNGALHVSIQEGGGTGGTSETDDGSFTAGSGSGTPVMAFATSDSVDSGDVGVVAMQTNRSMNVHVTGNDVASGGTSSTDDGSFTAGSGSGTPAMGFFSADTVDSGDVGVLAMDASRRLLVSIEADNAGIGGGTQYTEDDATPTNPVGNALLAERDDALGGLTPAEGDWTHLYSDANGALWVNVNTSALPSGAATAANQSTANSALSAIQTAVETLDNAISGSEMQVDLVSANVTNTGTFATQVDGDALTALQLIDDIVHADDASFTLGTSKGVMMMGFAGTQSVDANDAAALACDTDGALHVSDGGNSLTVDSSDLSTIAGAVSGSEMQVDIVSGNVTNAGTFAVQVDGSALTALQVIDNPVFVDDAAFTEDSSSVMVAGAVRDDEVGSTAVTSTDGDAGPLRSNMFGMLKVTQMPDATSEVKYAVIDDASSGDNTLVAAAGSGVKIRVLQVFLVAAGDVVARFESGAGGTALTGQMDLTTNSGFTLPFSPVGWFETADNALLNLELDGAVSVDGCLAYVEV